MMNDHRDGAILYGSMADPLSLAEVTKRPGCIVDGRTRPVALATAAVITAKWIEMAMVRGRTNPEPRGRLMCA